MARGRFYNIEKIWSAWNTRKISGDDAMLAIGKVLPSKKPKTEPAKTESTTSTTETTGDFEELRADFKRIYIEHYGADGWNQAIKDGSLPVSFGFTDADALNGKNTMEKKEV